ncbi:MAG: phosphatidylserine decarboxylase family protein [Candidatus Auribacterota bacterium]|jgi:phosphatidylserine decarboxylase|nr:phosphatidylserine decarboxylase family protein [Candidatus Auribacterota bacterium]
MKQHIPIAKEVLPFIIPAAVVTIICFFIHRYFGIAGLVICAYILYFFRDPYRTTPQGEGLIVSPADGKVIGVDQVIDNEIFGERVWRISIFLNIFNVHVNYAPIEGNIIYIKYRQGSFFPANSEKSAIANESNSIGIESNKERTVIVKQIAGLIARRIVCYCKLNDSLEIGQKIGLIRFGSRVEVYMPLSTTLKIKKGDSVKGKITVLGVKR